MGISDVRDPPLNARFLPLFFATAILAALLLAAGAVGVSTQTAAGPALSLLARDGRRSLPITLVGDQEFIALDDLAAAFQLTVREEAQGAITVSYNGRTIVL